MPNCLIVTHKKINLHLYESMDVELFYQQEKQIQSVHFLKF